MIDTEEFEDLFKVFGLFSLAQALILLIRMLY
jgi:hypothetical protein